MDSIPLCVTCGENPRAPKKYYCKPCMATQARERRLKQGDRIREIERKSKAKAQANRPPKVPKLKETKCRLCGAERLPTRSLCRVHDNERGRANRAKTPERTRQIQRESKARARAAEPEKHAEYNRVWREANPDKLRQHKHDYHQNHAAEVYQSVKVWRSANPQLRSEQGKRHHARYPERGRERSRRRRAVKAQAPGSFTEAEFQAKLELYKGRCHWCSKFISGVVHRDHVIALSLGGSDDISNVVPSCSKCNLRKGKKTPLEFAGRLF